MSTDSPQPSPETTNASAAPAESTTAAAAAEEPFTEDDGVLYDEEVQPEYGILGFTLRELIIGGLWLVSFAVSFFPAYGLLSFGSVWTQTLEWIQPIGLPTVAVFLIVLRRFSPDGIRRVGSLGIDQFASVVFSFAALYWVAAAVELTAASVSGKIWFVNWVVIVQVVVTLALVAATVFAPLIPGLREDFRGRLVTLAHRNANPVRPVIARPRPERPVAATPAPASTDLADEEIDGPVGSVPLTAHVSGGVLGTMPGIDDPDYVPGYARSSRGEVIDDEPVVEPVGEAVVEPETVVEPEAGPVAVAEPVDVAEPVFEADPAIEADVASAEPEIADDADAVAELLAEAEVVVETDPAVEPPVTNETLVLDDLMADRAPAAEQAPSSQPFWALAPTERDVHDEQGQPLFRIGPDAWALVLEDRGGAYVVRHDDGRIGYLHDIADITKG